MTTTRFIARSLQHARATHIGTALAAAVATAVLVGALVVGDSVKATLREAALSRLGDTHFAMSTGDRFFMASLAEAIHHGGSTPAASALELQGVATIPGSTRRANGVHILGVGTPFHALGGADAGSIPGDDHHVMLNRPLAEHLGAKRGDTLVLRVLKPSALSRDIPMGSETAETISLRLKVAQIYGAEWPGRFSLRAEQVPPFNAFVPLAVLQRAVGLEQRANLLLVGAGKNRTKDLNDLLYQNSSLRDYQAEARVLEGPGVVELTSDRVFLDPPLVEAAASIATGGQRGITYFVNGLRSDTGATPYSMVSAFTPQTSDVLPDDMADGEIVVTQWLAEDLGVGVGDKVTLDYYVAGDGRKLTEHAAAFTVRQVVPTEPPGGDRYLMPDFPGLTDADSPLDWEPPPDLNIDLTRIRKKDEQYWEDHRGAPKAFVSLAWAEKQWGTRFGTYTSIRWPAGSVTPEGLEAGIKRGLDPALLGLFFRDVRKTALQAAEQGYDFGQLFIGFSFFLIVAALVLTGLMFAFGVDQRTPQIGALLAMGFTPNRVKGLLLGEGLALALVGALMGFPLGLAYTWAVLWGLANRWNEVIGMTELRFHAEPRSVAIGVAAGVVMAILAMAWVLRRKTRLPVRALLAARYGVEPMTHHGRAWGWVVAISLVATALLLMALADRDHAAGAFFGAGAMLLLGGLFAAWAILRRAPRRSSPRPTLVGFGWRNTGRRAGRSLAIVAMLAAGTFLLVAINAFRHDPHHAPESATLGFDLFVQSTIPISHDLDTPRGREAVGLSDDVTETRFIQMRLLEGDEASCLNLNQPQAPPLLGIDPSKMAGDGWELLAKHNDDGALPALVDATVAQWVLRKKVGDVINFLDERGEPLIVKIVGTLPKSILQGYLVVSEEGFKKHFPSVAGYRVFLVDGPDGREQRVREEIERTLADYGVTATPTTQRLAMFNTVENTYLTIFSVLGGLGVLLGVMGLALVVVRNVIERRAELAVLQAIGFRPGSIRALLLAEHWGLVAMGLACGVASALLAVTPAIRARDSGLPYQTLTAILIAIAIGSLLWTFLAAALAVRGKLTSGLKND